MYRVAENELFEIYIEFSEDDESLDFKFNFAKSLNSVLFGYLFLFWPDYCWFSTFDPGVSVAADVES